MIAANLKTASASGTQRTSSCEAARIQLIWRSVFRPVRAADVHQKPHRRSDRPLCVMVQRERGPFFAVPSRRRRAGLRARPARLSAPAATQCRAKCSAAPNVDIRHSSRSAASAGRRRAREEDLEAGFGHPGQDARELACASARTIASTDARMRLAAIGSPVRTARAGGAPSRSVVIAAHRAL